MAKSPKRGRGTKKRQRVKIAETVTTAAPAFPALIVPPVRDIRPQFDDVMPTNITDAEPYVHDSVVAAEYGVAKHVFAAVRRIIMLSGGLENLEASLADSEFQTTLNSPQRIELFKMLSHQENMLLTNLLNVLKLAEKFPVVKSMLLNIQPVKEVADSEDAALFATVKRNPELRRRVIQVLKSTLSDYLKESAAREAKGEST